MLRYQINVQLPLCWGDLHNVGCVVTRLISFFLPLASQQVNFTEDIRIEGALVKLRKIVCFITARGTGSYNQTTRQDQVLVFRTMIIMLSVTSYYPFCIISKNKGSFLTHALTLGIECEDILYVPSASEINWLEKPLFLIISRAVRIFSVFPDRITNNLEKCCHHLLVLYIGHHLLVFYISRNNGM